MTSSKSARRTRREERRRRAEPRTEPRTEPLPQLRTAGYDARTIEFTGASGTGLPETLHLEVNEAGYPTGNLVAQDTEPPAMLRTQPPPFSHAGYDATTGPMPAYGRPPITIGDALTRDDHWGPKLTPLPCGHCGTPPDVPDWILERTRIIGHVNWLAIRAGWAFDCDLTWTCPDCQQGEAWKARQGQLEVWRGGGHCDRHDFPDCELTAARCRCPGAVLTVDVMLASEDHLGSGRGRYTAVAR